MQTKTTRAFRTISEASDELELQPHVLRFWESKFPQIKPIKRGGGRRFYRPDDIEFLRGIKTLLHDEKHPIKDVQKLIRVKGAGRVTELGRSVEKAARERDLSDTDLVPKRIRKNAVKKSSDAATVKAAPILEVVPDIAAPDASGTSVSTPPDSVPSVLTPEAIDPETIDNASPVAPISAPVKTVPATTAPVIAEQGLTAEEREKLETALKRLKALREQWTAFIAAAPQAVSDTA